MMTATWWMTSRRKKRQMSDDNYSDIIEAVKDTYEAKALAFLKRIRVLLEEEGLHGGC